MDDVKRAVNDDSDYNFDGAMLTLSVCKTDSELKIFALEWGRP